MMTGIWQSGLAPPAPVILGLQMEPLSLGHVMLIERYANIFSESPTMGDLIIATFICATPWERSQKNLQAWWLRLFLRIWGLRCRKIDFTLQLLLFEKYMSLSCEQPIFKFKPGQSRTMGSPWPWRICSCLMSRFGMSMKDALSIPLTTASALLGCYDEVENGADLWGDREERLWQRAGRN